MLALTSILVLAALTAPASAGAFDVLPNEHWVYDTLFILKDKGIIREFGKEVFDPTRLLTRYESALITARFLTNDNQLKPEQVLSTLNPEHQLLMIRLANEFAHELSLLGISTKDVYPKEIVPPSKSNLKVDKVETIGKDMIYQDETKIILENKAKVEKISLLMGDKAETAQKDKISSSDINQEKSHFQKEDELLNIAYPQSNDELLNIAYSRNNDEFSNFPYPQEDGELAKLEKKVIQEQGRVKRRIARQQALEERDIIPKRIAPKLSADNIELSTHLRGKNNSLWDFSEKNQNSPTEWPGFSAFEELRFIKYRDLGHEGRYITDFSLCFGANTREYPEAVTAKGFGKYEGRLLELTLGELNVQETSFEQSPFVDGMQILAKRGTWELGADVGRAWGAMEEMRFQRDTLGLITAKNYKDVWLKGLKMNEGRFGLRYFQFNSSGGGIDESLIPVPKSNSIMLVAFSNMKFNSNLHVNLEKAVQKTDDLADKFTSDEHQAFNAGLKYRRSRLALSCNYRDIQRDFERFSMVEEPAQSQDIYASYRLSHRLLLEGGYLSQRIENVEEPVHNIHKPMARIVLYPSKRFENLKFEADYYTRRRWSLDDNSFERNSRDYRIAMSNTMFKTNYRLWGGGVDMRDSVDNILSYKGDIFGLSLNRHIGDILRINSSWEREIVPKRGADECFELSINMDLPMDTDLRLSAKSEDKNKPGSQSDYLVNTYAMEIKRQVHEGREMNVYLSNSRYLYQDMSLTYGTMNLGADYVFRF